jgi:hypothetical protein
MGSLKIGLVDLDTSHPGSFVPILREMGHEVVGVFDGGSVWPAGYAQRFAVERDIPVVFADLAAMAEAVDVAIVHSANWDLHLDRARPFVVRGKGVLIDKPLIGNLAGYHRLLDWSAQNCRIFGGSSMRWTIEVEEYLAQPESERGSVHTVFAGCSVDDYNYGIHAYSLLSSIMGSGAQSVRWLATAIQKLIQIRWVDGKIGILSIGPQPGYLAGYATIVTERGEQHLEPDATRVYRRLLERSLPYLGGEVQAPPLPMRDLLEPELMALAARKSWANSGREVFLTDLTLTDEGYDGAAHLADYRRMRLTGTENFRVY